MAKHESKSPSLAKDVKEMRWKKKPTNPVQEKIKAQTAESRPYTTILKGGIRGPSAGTHACLLGDARYSNPATIGQKARMVRDLQRSYGNSYVQRVVGRIQAEKDDKRPKGVLPTNEMTDVVRQKGGDVKRKHLTGKGRAKFECDADGMLRAVAHPEQYAAFQAEAQNQIWAQGEEEEEKEGIEMTQRQIEDEEEEELQAKEGLDHPPKDGSNLEARINKQRRGGQSLHISTRDFFESRFGYDFSRVRVHTDAESDNLSRDLNARAFTTGEDIFFRQGEYKPGSSNGRELLAHELTHVVQQTGGVQPKLTIGQPGDKYEQEADHMARTVIGVEQKAETTGGDQGRLFRQADKEEEELIQTKVKYLPVRRQTEEKEEKEEQIKTKLLAEQITPLVQRQVKEDEEEGETLQTKRLPGQTTEVDPNLEARIDDIRGGGNPLQSTRLHYGQHILFQERAYDPGGSSGRELLSHELTQVIQRQGGSEKVGKKPATRTPSQRIDFALQLLRENANRFARHYKAGLDMFTNREIFASMQEAETDLSQVFFWKTGKFVLDQFFATLGKAAPYVKLVIDLASAVDKEFSRAREARSEAQIVEYVNSLIPQIENARNKMIDKIDGSRKNNEFLNIYNERMKQTNGEEYLKQLVEGAMDSRCAIPEATAFQAMITEEFAKIGDSVTDYLPVRETGRVYLDIELNKNGDEWKVEEVDDAWTLVTNAPKAERVASSLWEALSEQGKKPYETELPKQLNLTVEVEKPWSRNVDHHIYARFNTDLSEAVRNYPIGSFAREALERKELRKAVDEVNNMRGSRK